MNFTQENRLIKVYAKLEKDTFLIKKFEGKTSISDLYEFKLSLVSINHHVCFENLINKPVTVTITANTGDTFFYNGIISQFSQGRGGGEGGSDPNFSFYSAIMVPKLWLLTKTLNSRIFQNLSVVDILEKIFLEKQLVDFTFKLHQSYQKREYCVQYQESDFNFVSRLMEEEGIYYFFEHQVGKHIMIIADMPVEHVLCPHQESAEYHVSTGGRESEDVIKSLTIHKEIQTGKYALNDFNYNIPNTPLNVSVSANEPLIPGTFEKYEYPGRYAQRPDGERLSNIRLQEQETYITVIRGDSKCRAFKSGYRFLLKNYYRNELNVEYVLTEVFHEASQEIISGKDHFDFVYSNSFTAIPYSIPFRSQRKTPVPVIRGTQTALVVGPAGNEIYTDKLGRVKVQFYWDREGAKNESSSCWVRVSQNSAGFGWGNLDIPRIGHEVIVSFIEGNPDRPIIIGRVYNAYNQPPYNVTDTAAKSTMKIQSIGGGGDNEFRLDASQSAEEIYLHGQKDWNIKIDNDKNQTIGNNETMKVVNNRSKDVGVNQNENIGSVKSISVGSDHKETIGGNMSLNVGKNKSETVAIASALSIGGAYQISVGAAMNTTVALAQMEEIGLIKNIIVGDKFELTCGSGKLIIESSGKVTIKGTEFDFTSTGPVKINGSVVDIN